MPRSFENRLIVALDLPGRAEAGGVVRALGDSVGFYKVGLELFAAGDGRLLLDDLVKQGKDVFADLKLFDVPATVARATARIADSGAAFLTVHGNDAMMEAAAKCKGEVKILAVTALTSLDKGDLDDLGFKCDVRELVLSRAKRAIECGCDGVVSSGLEVAALRDAFGGKLITVTPGVRPILNTEAAGDDQKRTASPGEVIMAGGDYIVCGRPVRDADNPREAADAINKEINDALQKRARQ